MTPTRSAARRGASENEVKTTSVLHYCTLQLPANSPAAHSFSLRTNEAERELRLVKHVLCCSALVRYGVVLETSIGGVRVRVRVESSPFTTGLSLGVSLSSSLLIKYLHVK